MVIKASLFKNRCIVSDGDKEQEEIIFQWCWPFGASPNSCGYSIGAYIFSIKPTGSSGFISDEIVIYTDGEGYVFISVGLFLSVSGITGKLRTDFHKFSGSVRTDEELRKFLESSGNHLDTGIVSRASNYAWRRFALSECFLLLI